MFSLHDFVMKTLLGMVGNEPDYKVREYALGWYDKAKLTSEDMAQLDAAIEAKNTPVDTTEEEEITESEEVAE